MVRVSRRVKNSKENFRSCAICGEIFKPRCPNHKYCSAICRDKANKEKHLKSYKKRSLKHRICKICGKEFITNSGNRVYCSNECAKLGNLRLYKSKNSIIRFKVLERDGFKCCYCGRNPIEDNIKLEADHIIPKSKGGKYTMDNLITACNECNNIKKAQIFSKALVSEIKERINR